MLSLHNLHKNFGGLLAVSDVSFTVTAGMIVGLIGPNGAGKTTVFNLITGNYKPDGGEIFFCGKKISGLPTHEIVSLGIARTFQNIRLFSDMTVLENSLAGRHCRMRSGVLSALFRPPRMLREEKDAVKQALHELTYVGLETRHAQKAGNLSYGEQRLLEIARALATQPKFLILDEPAGGMNDAETESLMRLIRSIRNRGIAVLLIEHDMNLVMRLCDRLVVLEHGAMLAQGSPEEIKNNEEVIRAYLGAGD
ncbi:MAG: ABC transporter ATP-binding protein [Desulfovibrio sp.]|nr:ABC transporter ATP-binding protein [Desulfovibrio sp.]